MIPDYQIPEPFQFNPLKHHLAFIRDFISIRLADEDKIEITKVIKEIRHTGSSVMDVYTGGLSVQDICSEIKEFLDNNSLNSKNIFSVWTGIKYREYKTVPLSDTSVWMLKFHNDKKRFVHIFPAKLSPHTFRVRANTLKSAILYYLLIGKDFVTGEDLNKARRLLELSPVKNTSEAEAITKMVEILRSYPARF